ncbi:MAG: anion permease [Gammaproteobacteria bacterium]|nr:anion permease [Gammaproteobacteria bacterium]MDH3371366.1 anion permease [Gammaproteobacteria bacterium]MDH3406841.1 anion permease [Gammaproteobacteria bacterium]MDH5486903.1 anion permease [Gammaproteobacteria bacterium]
MATSATQTNGGLLGYLASNIEHTGRNPTRVLIGFVLGWVMFALIMWVFPRPEGLTAEGMAVLAIVVWASIMWVSEALPVGITGISVPTLLILTHAIPWDKGKPPMGTVFSGFTGHVVWLCLFAFMVGAIMQLLKLDRRIALGILDKVKASNVGRVIWGFFGVNILLAFFIPAANARAATLLPIVKGVTNLLGDSDEENEAKKAIVIQSLVYGTMICGVFIMTAHLPNLIMVDIFSKAGKTIGYLDWALLQFPYLGMFVLTQWWVRYHFRTKGIEIAGGHAKIQKMHKDLGPMSRGEWTLLLVFAIIALLFAMGKGSPIYQLHKFQLGIIGLIGMLVLFTPGLFPFKWKEVQDRTIWGTFLLLGGAITMTAAMGKSGLAAFLADMAHGWVTGQSWWMVLLILMLATHVIRIGMLSNVAAIAMLAPIVFALAPKLGLNDVALTLLVCDTDTYAYLLPTQITAAVIAYGSETFSTEDYAKAGWVCILIAIAYGILIMAPWYAVLGLPVWNASAPWPF